jgi:hypothetical protein
LVRFKGSDGDLGVGLIFGCRFVLDFGLSFFFKIHSTNPGSRSVSVDEDEWEDDDDDDESDDKRLVGLD